jgi:hypothetical protein
MGTEVKDESEPLLYVRSRPVPQSINRTIKFLSGQNDRTSEQPSVARTSIERRSISESLFGRVFNREIEPLIRALMPIVAQNR